MPTWRLKNLPNNRHQSERRQKAERTYLISVFEDRQQRGSWDWGGKGRVATAEGGGLSGSCGGDSFTLTVGLERGSSRTEPAA